jgi:photosystem II stability/assembly factor-like uncharacterized protein
MQVSRDSGETWLTADLGTASNLTSISALNSTHAITGGQNSFVAHTEDGAIWTEASVEPSPSALLNVMLLGAGGVGYALTATNRCSATADGGATWTATAAIPVANVPQAAAFGVDTAHLFVGSFDGSGDTDVGMSTSGCSAFSGTALAGTGSGTVSGIAGFGTSAWLIMSQRANPPTTDLIFTTTNSGTSWTPQTSPLGTAQLFSISARNMSTAWISEGTGRIIKTSNGGTNWSTVTVSPSTAILKVVFVSDLLGFALDVAEHVFRSVDGGATWKRVQTFSIGSTDLAAVPN